MQKVRLGIIGLGVQGSVYAEFLTEGKVKNMELGAICDTDPKKKAIAEGKYPNIPFYENYIELLENGKVDAVITCVPHYLHPEIGIQALERDIHVLVEKPAGIDAKQVKELNKVAASKPELTFGIMFNQRTNKLYQKVKEVINNGEIGRIRATNWLITTWWRPQAYYDESSWRATWEGEGGGVLVNQAPHQLDLFQWICGMPNKVFANIKYGNHRDITVDNDATIVLDYGDGATGVFITRTHDLIGTDRLEILGDKGKIVVDDSKKLTIYRLHEDEAKTNARMKQEDVQTVVSGGGLKDIYSEETSVFESKWGEQHINVLKNFTATILGEEPILAPGSDGIYGVELVNAIYLSSWLGKEVSLPVDEELFLQELNKRIEKEKQNSVHQ
ncbi:Gfo/Idh/MocA family oxidoreductase [Pseudogracilibacillus sp. SE30717A]|uniref:Gfo/Idh/MocA family protein n=1 Tax=Pseudogracilibacillus sp. SE30717A TaxID=3098293 RepID=UPI00300E2CA7